MDIDHEKGRVALRRDRKWIVLDEISMFVCLMVGVLFVHAIRKVIRGRQLSLQDFVLDGWSVATAAIGAVIHYAWAFKVWRESAGKPGWPQRAVGALMMGGGWRNAVGGGE